MFGYRLELVKDNHNTHRSTTALPRLAINKIFKRSDYETRERAQQIVDLLYVDGALTRSDFRYYTARNRLTKTVFRIVRW